MGRALVVDLLCAEIVFPLTTHLLHFRSLLLVLLALHKAQARLEGSVAVVVVLLVGTAGGRGI